jgi:heterodisulfide reductase subunit A
MYTAKQAILYKHRVPDGQAYVFYIDVRAGGKGYEEFVNRAMEEDEVVYLRGKVSKVFQEGEKVIVKGVDTLSNRVVEIAADLVVLAMAVVPRTANRQIGDLFGVESDSNGFYVSANEEFDPVMSGTERVFFAGCALGPKDIPETVAQASGAAAKVLSLFQQQRHQQPEITGEGLSR